MRKFRIVRYEYECRICKTRYPNIKQARECEKRKLEPNNFKIGDGVTSHYYQHTCEHLQSPKEVHFFPKGMIIKILGPEPMDSDYANRWLGGKLNGQHVYQYVVRYKCFCGKIREYLFYSVELTKIAIIKTG